jgi:hypothetical protein
MGSEGEVMGFLSNYPPGITDAHIEAYFGPSMSDAVADAAEFHMAVQRKRTELVELIKSAPDVLGAEINEELLGACEDGRRTQQWIEDRLTEEEAENAADEHAAALERRWEQRRDEGMGL